jgi:hypothetical protein
MTDSNHSFNKIIYASIALFVAGVFSLGFFIADVKGVFAGKNALSTLIIADLNFKFTKNQIISTTKSREGLLIEANIRLTNTPDPSETGSLISLLSSDKPLAGSVLLRQSEGEIDPKDRLALIWQRYLKSVPFQGPRGLEGHIFAPNSPYDGEVLFTDPSDPRKFAVRCLQATSTDQPEICLREVRIANGKVDLLIKFPRSWLTEWREIDSVVMDELNSAIAPQQSK